MKIGEKKLSFPVFGALVGATAYILATLLNVLGVGFLTAGVVVVALVIVLVCLVTTDDDEAPVDGKGVEISEVSSLKDILEENCEDPPGDANASELLEKIRSLLVSGQRLRDLLENLKIGYVILDANLRIDENHSPTLSEMFSQTGLAGKDAVQVLFGKAKVKAEDRAQMAFQLKGLFGMSETQWKISYYTFIKVATVDVNGGCEIRFHYFPYYNEDGLIDRIMIAAENITEYQSAKKQADARQQEMEKVFTLLQVSDSIFDFFLEETRILFKRLEEDIKNLSCANSQEFKAILERIFRSVHTIKGNSKLFALNTIQDVAHDAETFLQEALDQDEEPEDESRVLIANLSDIITKLVDEVESYASLRKKLLRLDDNNNNLSIQYRIQWIKSLIHQLSSTLRTTRFDIREVGRIQGDFARALSSFEKTSILEYLPRYENMVQELSQQLGKKTHRLRQDMDYRYFDAETLSKVNDFLVQSMRNAIDHGLEEPEDRENNGKPAEGTITIASKSLKGQVFVSVADDGRGIDEEKIVAKALERGLVNEIEAANLSSLEKINLVFRSGFTTTTQVTTLSGRGVGMDAVKAISEDLKGAITVDSKVGLGTKITLQFPEKTEEFISPFAIYDFHSLMENIIEEFQIIAKSHGMVVYENRLTKPPFFLGDQLSISEIVKCIFMDFFRRISQEGKIQCWLESFKGRRRVDSHEFFRLTFDCVVLDKEKEVWSDEWRRAETLIKSHKGSLIYREDVKLLELNLPSFLPVEFSGYKILVLFYTQLNGQLSPVVTEYFSKTLKGWSFELHNVWEGSQLPKEIDENPVIAFVQGEAMHLYLKTRSENNRERDSVIMISNTTEGIDSLEDTSIMPDNLVFLPMPLGKPAILQALTTVLLRRFASEMVRDPSPPAVQTPAHDGIDRRAS